MLREIREMGFEYAELSHGIRISLLPGIFEAVEAGEHDSPLRCVMLGPDSASRAGTKRPMFPFVLPLTLPAPR